MNLYEELRGVLAALEEGGVDYALVGGLAVAVWGAPRATKDIDLLVRPERLDAALEAVRPRGFTLKALPMDFRDGTTMQRVNKTDAAGNFMTLDLILVNRNLEAIWQSRSQAAYENGRVSVVSRDALIAMKSAAARPQDIADVQSLQELDR